MKIVAFIVAFGLAAVLGRVSADRLRSPEQVVSGLVHGKAAGHCSVASDSMEMGQFKKLIDCILKNDGQCLEAMSSPDCEGLIYCSPEESFLPYCGTYKGKTCMTAEGRRWNQVFNVEQHTDISLYQGPPGQVVGVCTGTFESKAVPGKPRSRPGAFTATFDSDGLLQKYSILISHGDEIGLFRLAQDESMKFLLDAFQNMDYGLMGERTSDSCVGTIMGSSKIPYIHKYKGRYGVKDAMAEMAEFNSFVGTPFHDVMLSKSDTPGTFFLRGKYVWNDPRGGDNVIDMPFTLEVTIREDGQMTAWYFYADFVDLYVALREAGRVA